MMKITARKIIVLIYLVVLVFYGFYEYGAQQALRRARACLEEGSPNAAVWAYRAVLIRYPYSLQTMGVWHDLGEPDFILEESDKARFNQNWFNRELYGDGPGKQVYFPFVVCLASLMIASLSFLVRLFRNKEFYGMASLFIVLIVCFFVQAAAASSFNRGRGYALSEFLTWEKSSVLAVLMLGSAIVASLCKTKTIAKETENDGSC